jgi:hypothetical protein
MMRACRSSASIRQHLPSHQPDSDSALSGIFPKSRWVWRRADAPRPSMGLAPLASISRTGHRVLSGCVLAVASMLVGCHSPSQYISPRVTGRVLDEQTQQPIAGVRVAWHTSNRATSADPVKGAQQLERQRGEHTDAEGRFNLPSARDLEFIWKVNWYGGTISFKHVRYQELLKTYSVGNVAYSQSGEPCVDAGDILLSPKN